MRRPAVPDPTVPMLVLIALWALFSAFIIGIARDWAFFWIFTGISAAGFAQQWAYFIWLLRRNR